MVRLVVVDLLLGRLVGRFHSPDELLLVLFLVVLLILCRDAVAVLRQRG
jgi:hypothetical protein